MHELNELTLERVGAMERAPGERGSSEDPSAPPEASRLLAPSSAARKRRQRALLVVLGLTVFVLASALLSMLVGQGELSDATLQSAFLGMRASRTAVAFLSGAALAVAGVVLQGLFRNPLASPSVLGTSAGALLGGKLTLCASVLLLHGSGALKVAPELLVPLGCVAGALLSLAALLAFAPLRGSTVTLILTGFVFSSLFESAGSCLTSRVQDSYELSRALAVLANGSVSGAGTKQVALASAMVLGALVPVLAWSRSLDLLLSGEEEAASLGVEVARVRFWSVIWASLMTAAAVAVGGSAGFVGLIVPHALRRVTGQAHRHLIPAAFFGGGGFLVLCDVLCRSFSGQSELPLSVVTGLIGAPVFLWMLHRLEREKTHG